jgi:DNA relaxase NicK
VEAFILTFSSSKGDRTIVEETHNIVEAIGSAKGIQVRSHQEHQKIYLSSLKRYAQAKRRLQRKLNHAQSKKSKLAQQLIIFLENRDKLFPDGIHSDESDMEDGSSWETMSHEEVQGSSHSPYGSEPSSVNKIFDRIS